MRAKPVGVDIKMPGGLFPSYALKLFAFGFHMFRSEFIAITARFIIYSGWRRHLLIDQAAVTTVKPSVSEGAH